MHFDFVTLHAFLMVADAEPTRGVRAVETVNFGGQSTHQRS